MATIRTKKRLGDLLIDANIITQEQIKQMGEQARLLVKEKLTPRQMAESALSIL